MRHYEMMLILRDDLTEETVGAVIDRVQARITDGGGRVIQTDEWGKRPFAYEIDRRHYGYYTVLDFEATAATVAEIERQLKIADEVVRFKTLRPDVRVRKPGRPRVRKPV